MDNEVFNRMNMLVSVQVKVDFMWNITHLMRELRKEGFDDGDIYAFFETVIENQMEKE